MIKISKIAKVCKSTGQALIYDVDGTQWIGAGSAIYPLYGMPEVDTDTIKAVLSLSEKDADSMTIMDCAVPTGISFTDRESGDISIGAPLLRVFYGNEQCSAYSVTDECGETKLLMIRDEYMRPFSDCYLPAELVYRHEGDIEYIAVMDGLILTGIVLPVDIKDDRFVESIDAMSALLHNGESTE